MIRRTAILLLLLSCATPPVSRAHTNADARLPSMHVEGRYLYDASGEKVILRGINKMVIWIDVPEGKNPFPEIAKTGANVTRIVWNDTGTAAALDRMIQACVDTGMIPMVEDHDATGKLDALPRTLAYWTRPDVLAVLKKHGEYLLLNIANEAGDETVTTDAFVDAYRSSVKTLRDEGLRMPLVIDAPDWGKNIDVLLQAAPRLSASDPLHNVMFSVHPYWRYSKGATDAALTKKLEESVTSNVPLLVGEFSAYVTDGSSDTDSVRYTNIMDQCQRLEIGWLVWEWGPGNMDESTRRLMPWTGLTRDGTFATLNPWGKDVALDHPNGIAHTSKRPASMVKRSRP